MPKLILEHRRQKPENRKFIVDLSHIRDPMPDLELPISFLLPSISIYFLKFKIFVLDMLYKGEYFGLK